MRRASTFTIDMDRALSNIDDGDVLEHRELRTADQMRGIERGLWARTAVINDPPTLEQGRFREVLDKSRKTPTVEVLRGLGSLPLSSSSVP